MDFNEMNTEEEDVFQFLLNEAVPNDEEECEKEAPIARQYAWNREEVSVPKNGAPSLNHTYDDIKLDNKEPLQEVYANDVQSFKSSNYHLIHPSFTWAGPLHNFAESYAEDEVQGIPNDVEALPTIKSYDFESAYLHQENDTVEIKHFQTPQHTEDRSSDLSSLKRLKSTGNSSLAKKAKNKGRQSKPRIDRSHMTEEQRREFLKKRNREAVRNCRKRKRDLITNLKKREIELVKENQRMRLLIQLNSPDYESNLKGEIARIVNAIEERIKNDTPNEKQTELNSLVQEYLFLFCDDSKDPTKNFHRAEIPSQLITEIYRSSYPSNYNKMFLWQNAQEDSYFDLESKGLWKEMCKYLELSEKQISDLKAGRKHVIETCKLVASMLEAIKCLESSLKVKFEKNVDEGVLKVLSKIFSVEQFAKLIAFFHLNERAKDLRENLDQLWMAYLRTFDEEIEKEEIPDISEKIQFKGIQPETEISLKKEQKLLEKERHQITYSTMKHLFEGPLDEVDYYVSQLSAHDEVEMFDPNFKQSIHGVDEIIRYIRKFRHAFKNLRAEERNFVTRGSKNVARSKWRLTGEYNGKLKMTPSKSAEVTFNVIIAYRFEPKGKLVKQLVVSWAAFDLMKQLGVFKVNTDLLSKIIGTTQKSKQEKEVPKERTNVLDRLRKKCLQFCRIFEADDPEERTNLVKDLIHPNCTWIDSNMGGEFEGMEVCLNYVNRLRKKMPTINTSRHNISYDKKSSKIHASCIVKGVYQGALSKKPKNFFFPASVSLVLAENTNQIVEAVMSWNAGSLMYQLADI